MTDNIIPFDPEATDSTKDDTAVDDMCDIAYTRAGVMRDRLTAVIDQLTHVNQAIVNMQADLQSKQLVASEVNQHLSDLTMIESLVESFESVMYE